MGLQNISIGPDTQADGLGVPLGLNRMGSIPHVSFVNLDAVPLTQFSVLILKRFRFVMLGLIGDVPLHLLGA